MLFEQDAVASMGIPSLSMVAISRVKVLFGGAAVVGSASSSFYTTGAPDAMLTSLTAAFNVWRTVMPSTCTIQIPNQGETFEDSTGALTDLWSGGTAYSVVGTDAGVFARGVGLRLVWLTSGITNSRRVQGSTFIVPVGAAMFDNDGTLNPEKRQNVETAANSLAAARSTDFTIWTRPRPGVPGKTSGVNGISVPDRITTLRSRRT